MNKSKKLHVRLIKICMNIIRRLIRRGLRSSNQFLFKKKYLICMLKVLSTKNTKQNDVMIELTNLVQLFSM